LRVAARYPSGIIIAFVLPATQKNIVSFYGYGSTAIKRLVGAIALQSIKIIIKMVVLTLLF